MSHNHVDYAALMRGRGFRVTPQRQLILDAVCEGHGHTTFDEIFARVQTKSNAVNRATVYRTLDFLTELRLVVAADVGDGRLVYEIAGETPHHHLVCLKCRQVRKISHDTVKDLYAKIEHELHFQVETDHLALFGYCAQCRSRPRPKRERPTSSVPAAKRRGPPPHGKGRPPSAA
jgi:Fur family ferric uptake transcriptional regulator